MPSLQRQDGIERSNRLTSLVRCAEQQRAVRSLISDNKPRGHGGIIFPRHLERQTSMRRIAKFLDAGSASDLVHARCTAIARRGCSKLLN
jgi:hypothetical protein